MNNFYDFIKNQIFDEVLDISSAKKVRRQIRKKAAYKPGTFGIELEFPADINDDVGEKDLDNPFVPDDVKYNYESVERVLRKVLLEIGEEVEGEHGSENSWGIGPDVSNVEMRSRYLTTKDFRILLSIFYNLRKLVKREILYLSPSCSAHVHIGLQQFDEMNAFDALATLQLIDEESAYKVAGHHRETKWAQPKENVIKNIIFSLSQSTIIPRNASEFEEIISDSKMRSIFDFSKHGLNKYGGTNLKSFVTNDTIEFRYLSSEVLKQPEQFVSMIQYYLMLPFLARKKMQLKFTDDRLGDIYFTREAGNQIKVSNKPVAYPFGGVEATRKPLPQTMKQRVKSIKEQRIVDYLKDVTVEQLHKYLENYLIQNEVPNFFNKTAISLIPGFNRNASIGVIFDYAKKNNLDKNAVFIGSLLRNNNSVTDYKDKKLSDAIFFEIPAPFYLKQMTQPFNSQLSSLAKIVGANFAENFENLYKFLYDTRAFG